VYINPVEYQHIAISILSSSLVKKKMSWWIHKSIWSAYLDVFDFYYNTIW
jgi:hypothetical protein